MPKIIENLQSRLLEEARKQIRERGYGAMTIRSVALACGVGVGTVYNYFPSKDALLAMYILEDWKACISVIETVSANAEEAEPVLACMYDQLKLFSQMHASVFQDAAAQSAYTGSFGSYHEKLVIQLAQPLRKFCDSDFFAEFVAEAMLRWSLAGKDFADIYGIIGKLF